MVTGTVLLALAGGVGVAAAIVFAVASRRGGRRNLGAESFDASDAEQAAALRDIQSQIDRGRGPLG